jgi:hypothetical protein
MKEKEIDSYTKNISGVIKIHSEGCRTRLNISLIKKPKPDILKLKIEPTIFELIKLVR